MVSSDFAKRATTATVYGAIVGAFIAHLASGITVTVTLMYAGALIATAMAPRAWKHGILGMWFPHRTPGQVSGQLNVPADYFMPYSVCPKCKVEALHWMERPDWKWAQRAIERMREGYETGGGEMVRRDSRGQIVSRYYRSDRLPYRPTVDQELAHEMAMLGADVLRECRDCDHKWSQKVGPLAEVA